MTKKLKKHIKRKYIKPVNMTEEERSTLDAEVKHAAAMCHVLGECLAKHLKKKFPKGAPENSQEIFSNDAYARFLNDAQLMFINGFGLSSEDIINCDMDLLPSKLQKPSIAGDDKKSAKKAVDTMLTSAGALSGIAEAFKNMEGQEDTVKQILGFCNELKESAEWLAGAFKISVE